MKLKETKISLISISILLFFLLPVYVFATDYTSAGFTVKDPVIDAGQTSSSSSGFGLGQSLSQSAIGKSSSSNFQVWSGFQYFFQVNANTLVATPGNTQVGLSWTVPQTFLGIGVSSYEVGVGTVSGSYSFTDVGNVTSYTQTGLTNNTPYFFKIKAKSAGGLLLVFSNEATATPVGVVSPPPPPPGGGGGGGGGNYGGGTSGIILKGLASPGATVFVLKDAAVAATSTADPTAGFNITLSSLAAGIYSFTLYAEDTKGIRTSSTNFIQSLTNNVTSTVDNIFLGPSISADKSTVKQGDTLNIFGFTAPASKVTVIVNSNEQHVENVTAQASGAWFQAFNTAILEMGSHNTKSQSSKENMLSVYSNTIAFNVGDKNVDNTGDCKRSDLNCDGRVNLTDFSILLFFWQQHNPSNVRVDINKDGIVNLTDFSILLFDWTG